MKGSQVGATEASLNWVGHNIHFGLGTMLIALPSQETAKEWSRQRLSQLIEGTSCLHGKIQDARRRDSGNTSFAKKFPGGFLKIAWTTSEKKLRSMPAALVLADEVDGMNGDVQGTGDPIAILKRRFTNSPMGKLYLASTPALSGDSRIEREFQAGDQRYYFVPCPFCGHFQRLVKAQLLWEKDNPGSIAYQCIGCKEMIAERYKEQMFPAGVWVATRDHDVLLSGGFPQSDKPILQPIFDAMEKEENPSFHLSAIYSPLGWYSWKKFAEEWDAAQKDQGLLKVFVNQVLGETWQEKGEAPDHEILWGRRESGYKQGMVPRGGLFLTAGVDVQGDRIEVCIIAWGRNKECWLVDYVVLSGRPSEQKVWQDLTALLNTTYRHESGVELSIVRMGVDSSFATQDVYAWTRSQGLGRVLALDPREHAAAAIGQPSAVDVTLWGKRIRRGAQVWPVATHMLKSELYGRLGVRKPEPPEPEWGWNEERTVFTPYPQGYYHFYEVDREFLLQLTAEQYVTKPVKGKGFFRRGGWVKTRDRNEALDTWVYARAAAAQFGVDRFSESRWAMLEKDLASPFLAPVQQQLDIETTAIQGPAAASEALIATSGPTSRPAPVKQQQSSNAIYSDDPYLT